ncbi:hypothetical protein GH714_030218 [Hevea brasiliensis]|uniref:Nodulin-related protein 1 n=1 Tax=Hevea brasiliensis TaxID=3981 RepID=A0A6A6LKD6_HEVBR|nr:hypothetical protein GH714_030218 [Hevea brasiliensis]
MDSSPASHSNKPTKHHQPSSSELLSSAMLVAEAAKASLKHETDKVDKGRVAGAAADLLGAASYYGKLEGKSFGKYVEMAENHLHQYHSSHSPTSSHSAADATHSSSHSSGAAGHSEGGHGGYGQYLKMAQAFFEDAKLYGISRAKTSARRRRAVGN